MDALVEGAALSAGPGSKLDRIEALYLRVLRAALLAVATLMLLCAVVWAGYSLVRVLRSPDSVVEGASAVASSEIVGTDTGAPARLALGEGRKPDGGLRAERAFYDGFIRRYYGLYRASYQPSLRADDKRLTIGEFDDLTVNSEARLDAVRRGELDFATDRRDLEAFLPVVSEASTSKVTADRLARYRRASKRAATTQVQRFRSELRRGWDTFSQACEDWYESPIGCAVTRRVQVPYSQSVTVMRYPAGIASPGEVLKGYQDRYFGLLAERRRANGERAAAEREAIVEGRTAGWAGLSQAILVAGGFLVLMFFFLLVAIERHQRRLAAHLARP